MAYLVRAKKIDLLSVLSELGQNAEESATKVQLADIITKSDGYNEELVKNLLDGIVNERLEQEKIKETEENEKKHMN